jgi:hypothetical protein
MRFSVLRGLLGCAIVCATALVVPGLALGATETTPKWALVNSSGTIVRMAGARSSAHLGTGTYEVIFKSNVTGCVYTATVGDTGAGAVSQPAIATVASRAGNANGVYIETHDQATGALVDLPFQVVVHCGTNDRDAVVAAGGALARGQHVTSTTHLGTGAYEVLFDKDVHSCAFTASIGTTGAGAVINPGQVTVAGRAGNVNGVFVATVDRTGASADYPFHLAVMCGKANLLGVIKVDGTKARGPNVVSSTKLSGVNGGTYEVIFDTTVAGCAYSATVGTTTNGGSITTPVAITTATRAGNPNGVFVFIHVTNGTTIDEPFHLYVFCPGATTTPVSSGTDSNSTAVQGIGGTPAPAQPERPGLNG